jgi:hypothetical protein
MIPLGIRVDVAALYADPLVTGKEAHPLAACAPSGELCTPAKLMQCQWDRCSKILCTHWQMVNYVSAVLLSYVSGYACHKQYFLLIADDIARL